MKKIFVYALLSSALLGCSFVKEPRTETDFIIDAKPTIDNEPDQEVTPNTSKSYTVKSGDTLGKIAKHHLGNANQYTILAEFNNIDSNAPIQIGQKLLIPTNSSLSLFKQKTAKNTSRTEPKKPAVNSATEKSIDDKLATKSTLESPEESQAPEIVVVEAYDPKELTSLYIQGEFISYLDKLYSKPGTKTSAEAVQAIGKQAQRYVKAKDYVAAENLYNRAIKQLPLDTEQVNTLKTDWSFITVDNALIDAQTHLTKGHHALSYEALKKAYDANATYCNENSKFITPRNEVAEQFHQIALRFYRAQELDNALTYWNKILYISPSDDLATVYKNRVTTLQRKLKEL